MKKQEDYLKKEMVFIGNIKKGDIMVINFKPKELFLVIKTGQTLIHRHPYFVTVDKNYYQRKWLFSDFEETQDRRFEVYRPT